MEDKDRLKETYDQLVAYLKDRFELFKIQLAERSAREFSALFAKVVVGLMLLASILFLSGGLAIYLGKLWGRLELGFAVVGGIYFLLFLILALLRRSLLQRPVMSSMIRRFFKEGDDE